MCSPNRTALNVILSIMLAFAGLMTCEVAGRFDHAIETGQPRELINQPPCGAIEGYDDGRRCGLASHS